MSLLLAVCTGLSGQEASLPAFRPPAVPLIVHDPYFSLWSFGDRLHRGAVQHWTGTAQGITSHVRINGQTYRIMGTDPRWRSQGLNTPVLPQTALELTPTRTVYEFHGGGVAVELTFLTPALPDDIAVLARPLSYVTWTARSTDGAEHDVSVYLDANADVVRNDPNQTVTWARYNVDGNTVMRMGTEEQPILAKRGDNLRIDWGYLYLVAPAQFSPKSAMADQVDTWSAFRVDGSLPTADDLERDVLPGRPKVPAIAVAMDLGAVGREPVSRFAALAYDDEYSVEFLERRQRPYWRRGGAGAVDLLRAALADYEQLEARCQVFDRELTGDLRRTGGEAYARMCVLAYRQTLGAHKITADVRRRPMMYSKECFSNGSIGTVDVTYPASPFFLLLNPELLKAQLRPIFEYAALDRWRFPYAPHDVGRYPIANGQMYGGGETSEERQMPVEESANMILMCAGIAEAEGNPEFADDNWRLLSQWAAYLREKGFDPESQLSTDDFTGHLAHNTNLSLKAIVALGAYAELCRGTGRADDANQYRALAEQFAARWVREADDGDHFRLAFDAPDTWSQKYNLVWDRILGLNLFPASVARKEIAYYLAHQNDYGLPLDNRSRFTKLDWIYWTATLAESPADFKALTLPAYRFAVKTPDRVPLTDWYWTHDARHRGFQARSVVGGLYVKMLTEPETWKKWASRAATRSADVARWPCARWPVVLCDVLILDAEV